MKNEALRNYLRQLSPAAAAQVVQTRSIEQAGIDHAFRLMRLDGLIARQTAAWEKKCTARGQFAFVGNAVHSFLRPTGLAYWHEQMDANGTRERWIGYGNLLDENFVPMQSEEAVAEIICGCLAKAGISHAKSRDSSLRILILE